MKTITIGFNIGPVTEQVLINKCKLWLNWNVKFEYTGGFTYKLPKTYTWKELQTFKQIWNTL